VNRRRAAGDDGKVVGVGEARDDLFSINGIVDPEARKRLEDRIRKKIDIH
jgi:hypothetical protein